MNEWIKMRYISNGIQRQMSFLCWQHNKTEENYANKYKSEDKF